MGHLGLKPTDIVLKGMSRGGRDTPVSDAACHMSLVLFLEILGTGPWRSMKQAKKRNAPQPLALFNVIGESTIRNSLT